MLDLLLQQRIIIVGGSGGVGKTSVSAALGILAATAGKKTLVLTIDPARRLAGALGLSHIGSQAVDVTAALQTALPNQTITGSLSAMMLDTQSTFHQLVERYVQDPIRRQRIYQNRLYQNISTRLSGSQEYAAMQQLDQLSKQATYETIILDTPPSTHALDFLTAPQRLTAFFDSKLIQTFLQFGGQAGQKLFRRGKDMFLFAIEKLAGQGLLLEIAEFFNLAEAIFLPYQQHAQSTQTLLRDRKTTFVIVSGPQPQQLAEASEFQKALTALSIQVQALIVNRVIPPYLPLTFNLPAPQRMPNQLGQDWLSYLNQLETRARQEQELILQKQVQLGLPTYTIPLLENALHSLTGLFKMTQMLSTSKK